MAHFALSAIGRDRPGIVATVTGVLLEHGVNVEDSQMAILAGHFSMTLVLALPDGAEPDALRSSLETAAGELGLEALSLSEVAEVGGPQAEPSHIVTVYGSDHPGIVHAVASVLAARSWDITDLNTRLVGEAGEQLYALMLEVAVPPQEAGALEDALDTVAGEQGVEVSVRELDADEL